jgi:hypothetical protein
METPFNNFRRSRRMMPITVTTTTKPSRAHPNFWRKYIFSTDHKIIGIQYGLTALCFMLFGFFLMLMMRWQIAHPGKPVPLHRAAAGKSPRPARRGRRDFARTLQFLRRDARHDHGVPGDRAAGVRGVRQLRRAADDRRAGHDVSARQHGELSGLFPRRRR